MKDTHYEIRYTSAHEAYALYAKTKDVIIASRYFNECMSTKHGLKKMWVVKVREQIMKYWEK